MTDPTELTDDQLQVLHNSLREALEDQIELLGTPDLPARDSKEVRKHSLANARAALVPVVEELESRGLEVAPLLDIDDYKLAATVGYKR